MIRRIFEKTFEYFSDMPFLQKGVNKSARKIIEFYQTKTNFTAVFAKIRFWDGPLLEIEKATPKKGLIYDLGCGEGLLTNFLGISSRTRKVVGIEKNKNRIKNSTIGLKNVSFKTGNILNYSIPKNTTLVISNVLHHLPSYKSQEIFLEKVSRNIKGGKLVIAEVDRGFSFKYLVCWMVDAFIVPILFEDKLYDFGFYHRSKSEWLKILKGLGFKVGVKNGFSFRPFPDVIFECLKK